MGPFAILSRARCAGTIMASLPSWKSLHEGGNEAGRNLAAEPLQGRLILSKVGGRVLADLVVLTIDPIVGLEKRFAGGIGNQSNAEADRNQDLGGAAARGIKQDRTRVDGFDGAAQRGVAALDAR